MAQDRVTLHYTSTSLSQVFNDIEKTFNIKLSFNSEVVKEQYITFHLEEATLDEILLAIENQVNITFKKESDRYYVIKTIRFLFKCNIDLVFNGQQYLI